MTTQPSPDRNAVPGASDKKVQLAELVFTMSWEDPALDRAAFGSVTGKAVATVSSGGCNALEFLLDDPASVYAFDYNPTQTFVLELKAGAFRALDHGGLLELMGVRPSARRAELLERIMPLLSEGARSYWAACPWLVPKGLLGGGRYERFVGVFQVLLRTIQGRRRLDALFVERDEAQRVRFFEREWDNWRWRLIFKAFFNKTVLARRGLSADYFTFDDGSKSFAESFANRTAHALRDLPVRSNYFVARYVLGRYLDESALPAYLLPASFPIIRARLDRLTFATADVRSAFDTPGTFDAICLSNVCELMSEKETAEVLARVARALRPTGRMTLRNLMIPRRVSAELASALVHDTDASRRLLQQDRSFVYSSFQVYQRSDVEV